jgi:hypothetical protein
MKKSLILIGSFLFFLSGCAPFSSNITFTPVFKDEKVSARSVPAKISTETDKVLEAKGYVYIGLVRLEDEVNSCWEKDCNNFACTDNLPHKDMMKEVLEKAAGVGGDLLVVGKNAKRELIDTQKESGPCVSYMDRYIEVPYCCKQGRGYCERTCYRTEKRTVCIKQATVSGMKCAFVTTGHVWRHDLELVKQAQQTKEYLRLKEVYSKNYNDKYRPDEVKFPEYVRIDTKYGFKDKSGKVVISPQFSNTDIVFGWSEGLQAVSVGRPSQQKWGFIDKTGEWVIQPTYDAEPRPFKEGLAAVSVDKKWGFINKKGIYVIKPQFMGTWNFSEGLAAVAVSDKWGYIDKRGNMVIEPQFWKGYGFSEGLAPVAVAVKKWGYIDRRGNVIIKPQFDYAEAFVKGIAKVVIDNRWGFINKDGERLAKGFDPW